MTSSQPPPGLIGIQRAAFDRAEALQVWAGSLQWGLAAIAVLAAIQREPQIGYFLAALALALTAAIIWLELQVAQARALGERVRRMTVIAEGLGKRPTSEELLEVGLAAGDLEDAARERDDPNYFASKMDFGMPRFGEMLHESAFWTCHLLRGSEARARGRMIILVVVAVALVLAALPLAQVEQNLTLGRFICATALFVISKDVFGAMIAYGRAATGVRDVLHRLERCAVEGWPEDRLVRIFGDYNAAVQSAPMPRPGLYAKQKDRINALWAAHKAA